MSKPKTARIGHATGIQFQDLTTGEYHPIATNLNSDDIRGESPIREYSIAAALKRMEGITLSLKCEPFTIEQCCWWVHILWLGKLGMRIRSPKPLLSPESIRSSAKDVARFDLPGFGSSSYDGGAYRGRWANTLAHSARQGKRYDHKWNKS